MDIWHYACKQEIDEDCPFLPGARYIVRKSMGDKESTHMSIDGVFIDGVENNIRSIRDVPKKVCSMYLIFIKKVC